MSKNDQRNKQRKMAIIIAVLVSIAMIVPSFGLLFTAVDNPNTAVPNQNNTALSAQQSLSNQIATLSNTVKANPSDSAARLQLANAYYDLGILTRSGTTPETANAYFKQAVIQYQELSKTNKDINIIVDMATAAFYGGDYDLADKTFKEAIAIKPDYLNGLVNYGVFLMNAKKDYLGAIEQWNTALTSGKPTPEEMQRINSFITQAQDRLQKSFEKPVSGVTNPNAKPGESK